MKEALWRALGSDLEGADALIMAAAVADYRALSSSAQKIKKEGERTSLELARNPDILAEIGGARAEAKAPVLVGFALETGDDAHVVRIAREKLASKRVDLVVANEAREALAGDETRATLVTATGAEPLAPMTKRALADAILDRVQARLAAE
jgi:phosphopantothenoylcysteine decarboxylase/phosphopantothenate--cysteine ligase